MNFCAGSLKKAGFVNWKMRLRWKILQEAAAPKSVEVLKLNAGIMFSWLIAIVGSQWLRSTGNFHIHTPAPPACVAPC